MMDIDIPELSTPSKEDRQRHVEETNASLRQQGLEITAEIIELQRKYIDGEISTTDLVDYGLAIIRMFSQELDPSPPANFH